MKNSNKKNYKFTDIKEVTFEELNQKLSKISDSSAIMSVFAFIPSEGDGGGDGTAITGCDSPDMC